MNYLNTRQGGWLDHNSVADLQDMPVGARHTLRPANHSTQSANGRARFLPVRLPHVTPRSMWSQKKMTVQAQCIAPSSSAPTIPCQDPTSSSSRWEPDVEARRMARTSEVDRPVWRRQSSNQPLKSKQCRVQLKLCKPEGLRRQQLAGMHQQFNAMNRSVRRPPWRDQQDHW
jgi:hypothetical protein